MMHIPGEPHFDLAADGFEWNHIPLNEDGSFAVVKNTEPRIIGGTMITEVSNTLVGRFTQEGVKWTYAGSYTLTREDGSRGGCKWVMEVEADRAVGENQVPGGIERGL